MLIWMAIFASLAVVAFVARSAFRTSGVAAGVSFAQQTGRLDVLIDAIEARPEAEQATQWDQAIGALWRDYAREEAARLVVEAAQRCEADVVQYWIRQVAEVEPEIAQEQFSEEFLAEHFRPEVAARCGRTGCCG